MGAIRCEIAVVGAGVVGQTAALALSRAGFKVALIGRDPPPLADRSGDGFDARVYALAPASRTLLASISAWDAMQPQRIAPVYNMRIHPAAGDNGSPVHLSAAQAHRDALAWIVEESNLAQALKTCVSANGLRSIQGTVTRMASAPEDIEALLTLADGQEVRTRLVVAADGAESLLRAMAGIATTVKSYNQQAVVCHLAIAQPRGNTAVQWFGDHGILALLPLPRNALSEIGDGADVVSMVWSTGQANADRLLQLTPEQLADEIHAISSAHTGSLRLLNAPGSFPLQLRKSMSLIGPRLVLAGDAAHVIHPLAGQGLNLGLGDVAALVQVLSGAKKTWRSAGFDPGHDLLLRRYQRHRREPVMAMQVATDGLYSLFDPAGQDGFGQAGPLIRAVRGAGWQLVANNAFLRRQIIRYATQEFLPSQRDTP